MELEIYLFTDLFAQSKWMRSNDHKIYNAQFSNSHFKPSGQVGILTASQRRQRTGVGHGGTDTHEGDDFISTET